MPTIACDCCFMGEKVEEAKLSEKCMPIIVHKNLMDRWVTSHVVSRKGADAWAVKISAFDLEQAGFAKFIYKSDGEPSIKDFKRAVVAKHREKVGPALQVIVEESGVGESQSNAHVERAIWEVEGLARTLMFAAQELHDVKVPLAHPVRTWAIEYSG